MRHGAKIIPSAKAKPAAGKKRSFQEFYFKKKRLHGCFAVIESKNRVPEIFFETKSRSFSFAKFFSVRSWIFFLANRASQSFAMIETKNRVPEIFSKRSRNRFARKIFSGHNRPRNFFSGKKYVQHMRLSAEIRIQAGTVSPVINP